MAFSLMFCGPKCSLCCTLLSAWGVIMLPIMGVLLHVRSLTFAEDILEEEHNVTMEEIIAHAEVRYDAAANTCFYATIIYVATFALSVWQFYLNKKNNRSLM